MASKKFRVQFINLANNAPQNKDCNVHINPKAFQSLLPPNDNLLKVGTILEISKVASSNPVTSTFHNVNLSSSMNSSTSQLTSASPISSNASQSNDDESSPIIFQIGAGSLQEALPMDLIRIDSAASQDPFSIKQLNLKHVNVTIVPKEEVTLDLVELLFKEQYLNGSDQWRIKTHMTDTCVFFKKNIEFCGMRLSVREMWMNGQTVTCGYISETTRFSFRSQSAMCTIYIQMSKELWEFDVNGEMYHEKAVNFLSELFNNWKNQACQHDVTIALFSRVFYKASDISEFPLGTNKCIKIDKKGRFYEDFYRIIYQNERYDNWMFSLVKLKHLIKEYRAHILNYHQRQTNERMPDSYLSNAAEGNFLETLNFSASVFERQYIDRPFDRTGMMSMVITAGCGVFEVDRELSKITKERVIDNGIGSDLVCLGEQPFHKVPLFKFANTEIFSVPHWINLSFYKTSETVRYCNSVFVPRVKLKSIPSPSNRLDSKAILPDYDPTKFSLADTDDIFLRQKSSDVLKRGASRIYTVHDLSSLGASEQVVPRHHMKRDAEEDLEDSSLEIDSDPETEPMTTNQFESKEKKRHKKSINPFYPSSIKMRNSFDRRRWAHLFPLRDDGTPIYDHWFEMNSQQQVSYASYEAKKSAKTPVEMSTTIEDNTSISTAGVAWKSLTIPACLPLTTDFYPSEKLFRKYFKEKKYNLIISAIREQYGNINMDHSKIKPLKEVFQELVGHRLAMGFQIVQTKACEKSTQISNNKRPSKYTLSLGLTYHDIEYVADDENDSIEVKILFPEKQRSEQKVEYMYRFMVPESSTYNISECNLCCKSSDEINWNQLDSYICIQGNGSLSPRELQKCWRQRLYLIPIAYRNGAPVTGLITQTMNDGNTPRYDVYQPKTFDELKAYRENYFFKFMDYLNKLERADERRVNLVAAPLKSMPSPRDDLYTAIGDFKKGRDVEVNRARIRQVMQSVYVPAMIEAKNGIPFIKQKKDIPVHCFVSADATWWCMNNIASIDSEREAVDFLQHMLDHRIIMHISDNLKTFVHGFYLYYFYDIDASVEIKKTHIFTKDYCEVGFCDLELGRFTSAQLFQQKDLPDLNTILPILASDYLENTGQKNRSKKSSVLDTEIDDESETDVAVMTDQPDKNDLHMKLVNVDVDPNNKSNRVEWASAIYRACYHPLCAFELEIYWKMATGQLLSELINNWSKLANRFNYHLVPATIDPFTLPSDATQASDPLRGPNYITLDLESLLYPGEKILFENFIEKKYLKADNSTTRKDLYANKEFMAFLKDKTLSEFDIEAEFQEFMERERIFRMQYLQEAILERFGFIRNASIIKQMHSDEDLSFFIHASGAIFVLIQNYYANYKARSRHPSAVQQYSMASPREPRDGEKERKSFAADFDAITKEKSAQQVSFSETKMSVSRSAAQLSFGKNGGVNNRERSASKSQIKYYELNKTNINNSKRKDEAVVSEEAVGDVVENEREISEAVEVLNGSNRAALAKFDEVIVIDGKEIKKKVPFYLDGSVFVGFMWSWNSMLGKRWKNQYTGEEAFHDAAFVDFRAFCSNKDDRLVQFYNELKLS